ncbi:hypothetical protein F2Q69_00051263 [Brassica cretica]|uniref:Uncharacterized protein n=1 Tax=Brassica cretica TaxID=69181 RepID=A0A8S9PHX9_BRACR|nr:hypothetical protein F2Q69_00051263 [Brassica cretica]
MEALIPKPTFPRGKLKPSEDVQRVLFVALGSIIFFFGIIMLAHYKHDKLHAPDIIIPSMDFTVLNMTEPLSVKWDLLIRIYPKLPVISYTRITPSRPKLLTASLTASLGDMDGAIVENFLDDIKEKGEMRFGSRLLLPECRSETSGKMNYACDEATLRFEPGSQRSATLFGNQPNCHYFP